MGVSVRTAVGPMNTALKLGTTIFLQGSFAGLPLVNQALAAEHPLGGGAFIVTVRSLMKVLSQISPASVIAAIAVANAPPRHAPAPPPPHGSPQPGSQPFATCSAEIDGDNPGFGGFTNVRIFGGVFLPGETVNVVEFEAIATTDQADTLRGFSVTMACCMGSSRRPTSSAHTAR